MVTGHENRTYELTTFEKDTILPIVVTGWQNRAIDEKINMVDMIKGMNEYLERNRIGHVQKNGKFKIAKVNGPRMRKVIHHIRVVGIIPNLVANSEGYFKTNDRDELIRFAKSLRERANSFEEVYGAMMKHNNISRAELLTQN